MKSNKKFFKKSKCLPVDKFFQNVLYDKKNGYYNLKLPIGSKGDFVTSPKISNLFSEMIAVWIVSAWEVLGRPKKINIVELGPGDGGLAKIILEVFKRFPEFDTSKKVFLFEISNLLKKMQKVNINVKSVKWIDSFEKIKNGPVIFFGNEFFDAIPIKQFIRKKGSLYEKYYLLNSDSEINEIHKKTSKRNYDMINSYSSLKSLKFIEFPKYGFKQLERITNIIANQGGCILMIDYGYLKSHNQSTIQSVFKHKKNYILNNLGKADITSHVNFELLKEFFVKNNLKIKKVITQKQFLENMGIMKRAEIIAKKMKFIDQSNLYIRLKRLLSPRSMGNLFKVVLAYNSKTNNFCGFK